MPDKFFSSAKSRKRKRPESRPNGRTTVQKKQKIDEDLSEHSDEWGGIDEIDLRPEEPDPGASGDEQEDETPAEKRLRLAQLYLDSVKESLAEGEFDAAEIDKELISSRLKQDVLEHSGKVHLFVADSYNLSSPPILRTRGHRFSVTSALASESGKYLFTSGKEGNIIKWDLFSGKRLATLHKTRPPSAPASSSKPNSRAKASNMNSDVNAHTDEVLALAISSDGKYLASGGRDRRLIIWDVETTQWNKTFQGPMNHKDVISALSFRKSTHQLFTASFDRTLKLYDMTPSVMGYVETLFGHQDSILAIDSLRGDNCVSVGGRDKTARYWKIVEETQLVFRGGGRSRIREMLEGGLRADADDDPGHEGEGVKGKGQEAQNFVEGSLECIAMIDETTFVTGGDSGSISLWATQKKKPIFTRPLAHGCNEVLSSTEGLIQTPRWITALAALRYSDLFVSGSWEGQLRLWKLDNKLKSFSILGNIPIPGVINSLQIIAPPKSFFTDNNSWIPPLTGSSSTNAAPALVVAGVGQEHRFGRWLSMKGYYGRCLDCWSFLHQYDPSLIRISASTGEANVNKLLEYVLPAPSTATSGDELWSRMGVPKDIPAEFLDLLAIPRRQ